MESFNKIEQAFMEFDTENPEVYKQLVRLARQWKAAGKAKLGIKTLFEKLRWEWHVAGLTESDGYKLNNNFTALYARKIMKNEADLDGLFEIRSLASERAPMVWGTTL
jgi:hydrogenase maturation factor